MRPQLLADTLARESDPTTSHEAAEVAARSVRAIRVGVLEIVRDAGRASSSEINATYAARWRDRGWKHAAADSPRKRAGELAAGERGLHYLAVVGTAPGENGVREAVYALTDRGREYLEAVT